MSNSAETIEKEDIGLTMFKTLIENGYRTYKHPDNWFKIENLPTDGKTHKGMTTIQAYGQIAGIRNNGLADINMIVANLEIDGKVICPLVELCYDRLKDIYGDSREEFSIKRSATIGNSHFEAPGFYLECKYFDTEFIFKLTFEEDNKEFSLSVSGADSRIMIDQLKMFDQLRLWGFDI